MHVVRTESDLECLADDELFGLIRSRIAETREYVDDFGELVFFVAVQPGDDVHAVDACLGFPVMVGWSRKSSLGKVTGLDVADRCVPSVVAAMLAIERGAKIVRVHDVAQTVSALAVWKNTPALM